MSLPCQGKTNLRTLPVRHPVGLRLLRRPSFALNCVAKCRSSMGFSQGFCSWMNINPLCSYIGIKIPYMSKVGRIVCSSLNIRGFHLRLATNRLRVCLNSIYSVLRPPSHSASKHLCKTPDCQCLHLLRVVDAVFDCLNCCVVDCLRHDA